jgi:hypothetical protein
MSFGRLSPAMTTIDRRRNRTARNKCRPQSTRRLQCSTAQLKLCTGTAVPTSITTQRRGCGSTAGQAFGTLEVRRVRAYRLLLQRACRHATPGTCHARTMISGGLSLKFVVPCSSLHSPTHFDTAIFVDAVCCVPRSFTTPNPRTQLA